MKHKIIAASICVLAPTLFAVGQTTQRLTADKSNEYALIYSLPKTVFDVTIETEHVIKSPGEFKNYANRHLGITNAIKHTESSVVVKSITIVPRGIPNSAERYAAQFKGGSGASMLLTDTEIPLAINLDEVTMPQSVALPKAVPAAPSILETDAAKHAVTLDITRASSQSKKAELTAQRIFELREQRNDLISGNVENMPPDGGAIKVALENLNAQEAVLTAMFEGTTTTFTDVKTVTFIPGESDSIGVIVARVSPLEGIVEVDDLSGIPLTLNYEVVERGKLPINEKGLEKTFPKGGIAYTIPGSASISLRFNGKKLASEIYDVAQLGVVFGLDPSWFTKKKAPGYVKLSPITGAVVELSTGEQQN